MHSIIAFVLHDISILRVIYSPTSHEWQLFSRIAFTWPINVQRRLILSADLGAAPFPSGFLYICA